MADDEKVYKVILAHPEMTRTEKVIVVIGWAVTIWYMLRPPRPRRG